MPQSSTDGMYKGLRCLLFLFGQHYKAPISFPNFCTSIDPLRSACVGVLFVGGPKDFLLIPSNTYREKCEMNKISIVDSSRVEQIGDEKLPERLQEASVIEGAKETVEIELSLSPQQAIRWYPTALFWALMVSMCVVMEGYDTILIGNFYAFPPFAKMYGHLVEGSDNEYQLTAAWQAGLSNASGVGAFFGALANGYLVGRFGQKRVLLGSLVVLCCFIAMTFDAPNIQTLCAGEFEFFCYYLLLEEFSFNIF
jgi:hypothetical protein